MNNYDKNYLDLTNKVISEGERKADRTGTGTYSIFGDMLAVDMRQGFPLLTTKKIHFKSVKHEFLWFLKGGDNIKYLVDNGVNIWNEWPHQRYTKILQKFELERNLLQAKIDIHANENGSQFDIELANERLNYVKKYISENPTLTVKEFADKIRTNEEFAANFGGLGPVYGKQWVDWIGADGEHTNQLKNVIEDLKNNPDSRRIMVNAWNAGEIKDMLLPPCHYAFQFWTRVLPSGKRELSLAFNMRSVDMFLGMPFDIASYGLLLSVVAHCVDMEVGMLKVFTGDTHVYINHIDQVKEQTSRLNDVKELPILWLNPKVRDIFEFRPEDIEILDYQSHPGIKADVAV